MKSLNTLIMTLITAVSLSAFAGAEHDHGAPTFQPPKGGILKSTHETHFELVKKDKSVTIYAYDKDGKALPTKGFKLTAELEIPRKKSAPLALTNKDTHWEASVDAASAHRYSIKVNIDDGKEKDHVKFTVENK